MPVGLRDGAERDLGDLRAAADDDDPLAEDPVHGPGRAPLADARRAGHGRVERSLVDAFHLDLGLDGRPAAGVIESPDRAQGAERRAGTGEGGQDRRERLGRVVMDHANRDGRRGGGPARAHRGG